MTRGILVTDATHAVLYFTILRYMAFWTTWNLHNKTCWLMFVRLHHKQLQAYRAASRSDFALSIHWCLPLQILLLKNIALQTILFVCQLSTPTVQSIIARLCFPLWQLSAWKNKVNELTNYQRCIKMYLTSKKWKESSVVPHCDSQLSLFIFIGSQCAARITPFEKREKLFIDAFFSKKIWFNHLWVRWGLNLAAACVVTAHRLPQG